MGAHGALTICNRRELAGRHATNKLRRELVTGYEIGSPPVTSAERGYVDAVHHPRRYAFRRSPVPCGLLARHIGNTPAENTKHTALTRVAEATPMISLRRALSPPLEFVLP